MTQLQPPPAIAAARPERSRPPGNGATGSLALWQLNLLRVGYAEMGIGLALIKWPLLVHHEPWGLAEGTKECLFIAMSVLALLGIRYPSRMLPVLIFEVTWKLLWLSVVAFPSWRDHQLDAATRTQVVAILWGVVILAVIPWRQVVRQFITAPGDPWRR